MKKATRADLYQAIEKLQAGANLRGENAARDYLALGEIYMILSRFSQAREALHKAISAAPSDIDLQCLAFSDLADVESTLGNQADSLKNSKDALDLADRGVTPRVKARALESQALALLYNPDPAEALDRLQSARTLLTGDEAEVEELARCLLYFGYGHLRANNTVDALNETLHAFEIWKKAGDIHGTARANAALGLLWATLGEPARARAALNAALSTFRRIGDNEHEAGVLNSLGILSTINGDHAQSLIYFRRSQRLFRDLEDPVGEIEAISGQTDALKAMRKFKAAEDLYLAASKRVWKENSEIEQSVALLNLADIYASTGRSQDAYYTYLDALSLCQERNEEMNESEVLFHLGAFLKSQERYEEAIAFLLRALNFSSAAERPDKVAQAHFDLAGIRRNMADLDSARKEIESAIDTIESHRNKLDTSDSRAFYFSSVHSYFQLYIDILMDLYREKGGDYAIRAFEASEKSKVRSLLDVIEQTTEGRDCHRTASAADDRSSVPCEARPVALGKIQDALRGDNAILLEYAMGSDRKHGYLWAVDENGISVWNLPDFTQLESQAQKVLNAMTARLRRGTEPVVETSARVYRANMSYRRDSAKLAEALWGHVKGRLSGKRMMIVPDGELPGLPYAMLISALPPSSAPGSVVTLPSASLLVLIRSRAEKRPRPPALAAIFDNPVYNPGDPRIHAADRRNVTESPEPALAKVFKDLGLRVGSIPDLRSDEAQAIRGALHGGEILRLTDFNAGKDAVLHRPLGRYRYLHFSVHGLLDTRYPEFSGLLLSLFTEKGRRQNGYLTIPEIYNLHLAADVVVLSACDTALGKDLKSEGMIALPRAFLSAGASSVVSTLWKVNQDATAKLMERFYRYLGQSKAPDVALQLAQAEIRRSPQWSHPYYWAGFVFQGDYRPAADRSQ